MSRQQVSEKQAIFKHKSKFQRPDLKEAAEKEKAASKNSFIKFQRDEQTQVVSMDVLRAVHL